MGRGPGHSTVPSGTGADCRDSPPTALPVHPTPTRTAEGTCWAVTALQAGPSASPAKPVHLGLPHRSRQDTLSVPPSPALSEVPAFRVRKPAQFVLPGLSRSEPARLQRWAPVGPVGPDLPPAPVSAPPRPLWGDTESQTGGAALVPTPGCISEPSPTLVRIANSHPPSDFHATSSQGLLRLSETSGPRHSLTHLTGGGGGACVQGHSTRGLLTVQRPFPRGPPCRPCPPS